MWSHSFSFCGLPHPHSKALALKQTDTGVAHGLVYTQKSRNQRKELINRTADKQSREAISNLVSLQLFMITLFAKDTIWEITAEHSTKSMKFSPYNFQSFIHSFIEKGNKNWNISILNILTKRLQWEGSETISVSRVKTLILLDVPYKNKQTTTKTKTKDLKAPKQKFWIFF